MTNKEATDTEIPNSDSNSTQDNINFGISNTRDKRLRVTKRQKRINWRRNAVMQAMIQGVTSSYDVAKALSISQTTAFKDIQWLKNNATNELQYHIQERIPWSHKVCTEGISEVLRYAWSLVLEQDNRTNKIATLALILQCYKELMDISTNASVITEAMNEVERMKQEVLGYTNIVKADRHEIISTDQKEGGDLLITLKDLARIISNLRANNEPTIALEPEVQRATALYYKLKEQHNIAKAERIQQWFTRHPEAKDFAPSDEERKQDIKLQEWLFLFIDELRYSPEVRYQRAKNPAHGFGHTPKPEGIHRWSEGLSSINCVPGCRYYESTGTIGTLEVLSWFEGYDKYDDVLAIWCEKQEDAQTQ